MKTIFYTILLLVFSACCKNTSEPDLCSTETRVRFYNGTDVSFERIRFYDRGLDYPFYPDALTPYYTLDPQSSGVLNNIVMTRDNNISCHVEFDYSQIASMSGCYTIYITDVDTYNVFRDTTLWYKIIPN